MCTSKAENIKLISLSVSPDDSSLRSGPTVVSGLKQFYPFFKKNRMFQLGSYILRVTILNSELGNLILQPDLTRCWLNGRHKWWLGGEVPQVRIWEKIGGSVEIWLQYKNYKFEIFYFFYVAEVSRVLKVDFCCILFLRFKMFFNRVDFKYSWIYFLAHFWCCYCRRCLEL